MIGYGRASSAYRKAGWSGVLPLAQGTKWPPPTGFTGWTGREPTGADVLLWNTKHKNDGLALRLPKGVVGIDVDHYGSKKGADTLAELEDFHGPLPPTWSSTSRGPDQPSRIYLFRCPDDLVLPGKPGDSIEFIQPHHRYTVAWPTVVEGRAYRWYDPDGRLSERVPRVHELAELPATWHRIQAPQRASGHYEPRAVTGEWSKAVAKHHADAAAALRSAGGRHDAMLPAILTMVRLDHDGHPGAAEALDDLHGRFVSAVADRSSVKDAEAEWARMELGAVGKVATTPSTRDSYGDLIERSKALHPSAPTRPFGDFEDPLAGEALPEVDEDEPADEWEFTDLAEHVAGTFTRPAARFLRIT